MPRTIRPSVEMENPNLEKMSPKVRAQFQAALDAQAAEEKAVPKAPSGKVSKAPIKAPVSAPPPPIQPQQRLSFHPLVSAPPPPPALHPFASSPPPPPDLPPLSTSEDRGALPSSGIAPSSGRSGVAPNALHPGQFPTAESSGVVSPSHALMAARHTHAALAGLMHSPSVGGIMDFAYGKHLEPVHRAIRRDAAQQRRLANQHQKLLDTMTAAPDHTPAPEVLKAH